MADDVRVYPNSFNNILKNNIFLDRFKNVIHYNNYVYIIASQLINLYAIDLFNNKQFDLLHKIDRYTSRYCLIIASSGHYGRTIDISTLPIKQHLQKLYDENIKPYSKSEWSTRQTFIKNITNSLDEQIFTNIKVNIKEHFIQRIKDFVNKMLFEEQNNKELNKLLKQELKKVKNDLINNTLTSDSKYHSFINEHINHIRPKILHDFGLAYDLEKDTMKYLYPTMYMNHILESNNVNIKLFRVLPLRDSCINHFMPIDYQILGWLFPEYLCQELNTTKTELAKSVYKEFIFDKIFNMDSKIFNKKGNREFDYLLLTDGISCRLLFRSVDSRKKRKEGGTQVSKTKSAKIESKKSRKDAKDKFRYINDLTKKELKTLKDKTVVGIDPGKSDLFHVCISNDSEKEEFFSYSSKKKRSKDYSNKLKELIPNIKKDMEIDKYELELSQSVSNGRRSMNLDKFKNYVKHKLEFMIKIEDLYSKDIWNKLSWRSFIRNQQVKEDIVKTFKDKVNSDSVLLFGDWSHKNRINLKNNCPSMGLSILRLLKKHYPNLYLIDEYRTSCICSNCHSKCENSIKTKKVIYKDKNENPIYRKVHKILRCTNESCRIYWNRDVNGSLNITKNGKLLLLSKELPEIFRRSNLN